MAVFQVSVWYLVCGCIATDERHYNARH